MRYPFSWIYSLPIWADVDSDFMFEDNWCSFFLSFVISHPAFIYHVTVWTIINFHFLTAANWKRRRGRLHCRRLRLSEFDPNRLAAAPWLFFLLFFSMLRAHYCGWRAGALPNCVRLDFYLPSPFFTGKRAFLPNRSKLFKRAGSSSWFKGALVGEVLKVSCSVKALVVGHMWALRD